MKYRIVWPALLSVLGTIPLFAFGPEVVNAYFGLSWIEPKILIDPLTVGFGLGPALMLLLVSLWLLIQGSHQSQWGILAIVFFGLFSTVSVVAFPYLLMGQWIFSVPSYIVVSYLIGPPIGLAGAVWARLTLPKSEPGQLIKRM